MNISRFRLQWIASCLAALLLHGRIFGQSEDVSASASASSTQEQSSLGAANAEQLANAIVAKGGAFKANLDQATTAEQTRALIVQWEKDKQALVAAQLASMPTSMSPQQALEAIRQNVPSDSDLGIQLNEAAAQVDLATTLRTQMQALDAAPSDQKAQFQSQISQTITAMKKDREAFQVKLATAQANLGSDRATQVNASENLSTEGQSSLAQIQAGWPAGMSTQAKIAALEAWKAQIRPTVPPQAGSQLLQATP